MKNTSALVAGLLTVGRCSLYGICAVLSAYASTAQAVTLNFEDRQPPITLLNQYSNSGVTFNGPQLLDYSQTPGFAHSGTRAIELCFAIEFCTTPLNVSFTTGQRRVRLWVGTSFPLSQPSTVVLQARDQNNVLVGQASTVLGPSNAAIPVQSPLAINAHSPSIRKLVLMFTAGPTGPAFNNGLVVDDLEFDNVGNPPVCGTTQSPTVSLSQPPNGETVNVNEFLLQGTVTTAVPLDEATLIVAGPGSTKSSDLLGASIMSQTGGPFGSTWMDGFLAPGTNTVTVRVKNCHGTGQRSRTVVFSPIISGTRFKLLGIEITQATQDLRNSVPLVADKPTMVRLYLAVTGPTTSIAGVSGAITAAHPGGATLPNLQSVNTITVDSSQDTSSKRLDLTASLNFVLPPNWTASATLHFSLSQLYIQSFQSNLPCDACENLDEIGAPRYVVFRPTRPLNLVLVPYEYSISGTPTPDILFTPMGALQWLNNVYPVSGSFPTDGSGIRLLRYLPTRTTGKNLHNDDDGGDFLDDLQDILNGLQEQAGSNWPADVHIFAMTPCGCGGRGFVPGSAAYGDTWAVENGPVPSTNFESYGAIWAQEIAHNFGRNHAGNSHNEQPPPDLAFPYPHGSIGEPGLAISTEWWNGAPFLIAPGVPTASGPYAHAHDFMSYGSVNDLAEHTYSWVSPYSYGALFRSFEVLSQARVAAPARVEKLVVAGRINMDGAATFRPFHLVTTAFSSSAGDVGEYTIELVDAEGRTLGSHRFNVAHITGLSAMSFSEFVLWKPGTRLVVLKGKSGVLARRAVSPHKPWVRVTSPKGGETWRGKATVTWEAGDEDNDPLSFTVLYNNGVDEIWLPIANGITGLSASLDTAMLPGSTRARVRVRVSDGVNTAEADSAAFTVPDKPPQIAILTPINGQVLAPGSVTELVAAAYDPEDGMLPGSSLTWTSDRDGHLGHGQRLSVSKALSRGPHLLTVTAVDRQGRAATARVNVVVGRERLRAE
jgi:hypothetical protein